MKKLVAVLLLLTVLLSTIYSREYISYSASSNNKSQNLSKQDEIWIISDSNNFLWNRYVEEALRDEFTQRGIKVFLNTDYFDVKDFNEDNIDLMYDEIFDSTATHILFITIEELYTFTYGGGIKQFDTTGSLIDLKSGEVAFRVGIATEADSNDQLSYNATCKGSTLSMASALATEYMRYVK